MQNIKIAVIGAGLIGEKRCLAIKNTGLGQVVAVVDPNLVRARYLADMMGCSFFESYNAAIKEEFFDVVIVAVPNKIATQIVLKVLTDGKHVFCEKPFGTTVTESENMIEAARRVHRIIKVGFNHRFHQSILKAKEFFDQGKIGKPLFIRSRYGHGGRLGMEKEWRFQREISGGGELLDQGVHIVDLCRWFGGEFDEVYGVTQTKFWNTDLDDNAFAILKNKQVTASFHVSATNWKNIFSFEIFGDLGFLVIEGKGGSYGEETLVFGRRLEKFGVPEMEKFVFSGDSSWSEEWRNFVFAIVNGSPILGDMVDGLEANKLVEKIYKSSLDGNSLKNYHE